MSPPKTQPPSYAFSLFAVAHFKDDQPTHMSAGPFVCESDAELERDRLNAEHDGRKFRVVRTEEDHPIYWHEVAP